jgi:malonyl-CoA O-methyltransferase
MKKNYFNVISPPDYVTAAIIGHETTVEMINRLEWMALQPKITLDIGSGIGEGSDLLKKRYPDAQVLAMDQAFTFLSDGKTKQTEKIGWVNGDVTQLPLKSYTVDLIFANLLLPWCDDFSLALQELYRVLKPGGLFMFSCLGPDTLQEIPAARNLLLPDLIDMHHIGDAVLQAGFKEPVMDVQYFTLQYHSKEKLIRELYASGMVVENDFVIHQDECAVSYEVIYGHAWGGGDAGEVRISIDKIQKI